MCEKPNKRKFIAVKEKNTIKAGGSTAICKMSDWMGEWVIPLRLLRLLEHLRC